MCKQLVFLRWICTIFWNKFILLEPPCHPLPHSSMWSIFPQNGCMPSAETLFYSWILFITSRAIPSTNALITPIALRQYISIEIIDYAIIMVYIIPVSTLIFMFCYPFSSAGIDAAAVLASNGRRPRERQVRAATQVGPHLRGDRQETVHVGWTNRGLLWRE